MKQTEADIQKAIVEPGEFAALMVSIDQRDDIEHKHLKADAAMVKLLKALGYGAAMTIYEKRRNGMPSEADIQRAMTPEQFLDEMRHLALHEYGFGPLQKQHLEGDKLMCKLLTQLGYSEGVKIFQAMGKWYA